MTQIRDLMVDDWIPEDINGGLASRRAMDEWREWAETQPEKKIDADLLEEPPW